MVRRGHRRITPRRRTSRRRRPRCHCPRQRGDRRVAHHAPDPVRAEETDVAGTHPSLEELAPRPVVPGDLAKLTLRSFGSRGTRRRRRGARATTSRPLPTYCRGRSIFRLDGDRLAIDL